MVMATNDLQTWWNCRPWKRAKIESIKSFKCQICEYATNNNRKLNKHIEEYHDNETIETPYRKVLPEKTSEFTCGICHISFRDETGLFSHLREDNHDTCNINDERDKSLKNNPVVVKTKLKHHLCGLCPDLEDTREGLSIHLRVVHHVELPSSDRTESPPQAQTYEEPGDRFKAKDLKHCPLCLFNGTHLARHVKAVHYRVTALWA